MLYIVPLSIRKYDITHFYLEPTHDLYYEYTLILIDYTETSKLERSICYLISSIIYQPLDWLFRYFLGIEVGRRNIENENLLRVQIKTMNNRTIPLCLRQEWTIRKVKEQLAQILDINDPESLGILFCGREISNDVLISTCDLGQHSVLHAVQIVQKN